MFNQHKPLLHDARRQLAERISAESGIATRYLMDLDDEALRCPDYRKLKPALDAQNAEQRKRQAWTQDKLNRARGRGKKRKLADQEKIEGLQDDLDETAKDARIITRDAQKAQYEYRKDPDSFRRRQNNAGKIISTGGTE